MKHTIYIGFITVSDVKVSAANLLVSIQSIVPIEKEGNLVDLLFQCHINISISVNAKRYALQGRMVDTVCSTLPNIS